MMAMYQDDVDETGRIIQHVEHSEFQVLDVSQMCRICAEFSDELVAMFGKTGLEMGLIDKIHTHLPIKVTEHDDLPLHCCNHCIEKLNICHDLTYLCLEADWSLRSWLESGQLHSQSQDQQAEMEESPERRGVKKSSQSPLRLSNVNKALTNPRVHEIDKQTSQVLSLSLINGKKTQQKEKRKEEMITLKKIETEVDEADNTKGNTEGEQQIVAMQGTYNTNAQNPKQKYKVVLVKLKNSSTLSKDVQVQKALEILKNKQEAGKLPPAKGRVPKRLQKKLLGLKTYGLLKLNKSIRLPLEPNDYKMEESTPVNDDNDPKSSPENSVFCSFCDEIFADNDALNSHVSSSHQNILFCYCSETFETQEMFDEHLKSHFTDKELGEQPLESQSFSRNRQNNIYAEPAKYFSNKHSQKYLDANVKSRSIEEPVTQKEEFVDFSTCEVPSGESASNKSRVIFSNLSESTSLCESIIASVPKMKMWRCKVCGLVYPTEELWLIHCQDVHFRCHFCNVELRSAEEQQQHEKRHKGWPFSCRFCHQSFPSKEEQVEHSKQHINDDKPFKCKQCDKGYRSKSGLFTHRLSHATGHTFPCRLCGKQFALRSLLVMHKRTHHFYNAKLNSHVCHVCGKVYRSRYLLIQHHRTHTNSQPFKCTNCDKRFHKQSLLYQHMFTHTGNPRHKCTTCGRTFNRRGNMLIHARLHNTVQIFTCKKCRQVFDNRSTFLAHRAEHVDKNKQENTFQCLTCNKLLASKLTLQRHMFIHTRESKFSCEFCGKKFRLGNVLATHRRVHTGEKPYLCCFCNESFSSKSGHTVHERIHTGQKPFPCDKCDKAFRCRGSLNQHKIVHSDQRPFSCGYCEKSFRRRDTLDAHVRTHTNERPYVCVFCNQGFRQKGDCSKHERRHTKINVATCPICFITFVNKNERDAHVRNMHLDDVCDVITSDSIVSDSRDTFVISIHEDKSN